jgi:hypothetical protein
MGIIRQVVEQLLVGNTSADAFSRRRMRLLQETTNRNVADAVVHDSVRKALVDFAKLAGHEKLAIIGGLALGAHARPRYTEDVDVAVSSEEDVERIAGQISTHFKRVSPHNFEHKKTGVTIEFTTPSSIDVEPKLIQAVLDNAEIHRVGQKSIGVADVPHLIAMKLKRATGKSAKSMIDRGDIIDLLQKHGVQDLSELSLSKNERELLDELRSMAAET